VLLYELVINMDNSLTRKPIVHAATTGEPKVRLPADLFQVGHWYYIQFGVAQGAYLGAATGDLQTYTLPVSISRADSALFQVVMP
jgi:hypothetical protein